MESNFTTRPSKFLIFVTSKLFGAKTKTLKPIKFYIIYIYIYIYVRTRFASQAKWFGQWPNEPKTMNLLESGPDIERSMS